jgi:acyl carrier protein
MRVELEDLAEIFKKVMGEDTIITQETKREDVAEWDSLNHLNLVLELIDFYKVEFTPEEIAKMNSIKRIIEIIESK